MAYTEHRIALSWPRRNCSVHTCQDRVRGTRKPALESNHAEANLFLLSIFIQSISRRPDGCGITRHLAVEEEVIISLIMDPRTLHWDHFYLDGPVFWGVIFFFKKKKKKPKNLPLRYSPGSSWARPSLSQLENSRTVCISGSPFSKYIPSRA
jgi:hypothetical protein